ncbi:MAG: hypothetical protein ACREJ4_15455, partial [Candidatus Methylomirabilaceae bacterium]
SSRPVDLKSFARQEGRFGEIYAVAERSFGRVLPHWRACRAYHRLVDHSWPVARWVLWPDRDLLPNSLGQCLRKQFPLLLDRGAARRVSRGAGS